MSRTDTNSSDDSEQLHRMYRGYDDDHNADSLSDFGLELPIDETNGVVVPLTAIDHIPLHLERNDEFPVEHAILRPVGVGPSQAGMFSDVEGTETVFVTVHPVREYDSPGHYVQAEPKPETASIERNQLDTYCSQYTTVKPMALHSPYHWQNPDNDAYGHCDDIDY